MRQPRLAALVAATIVIVSCGGDDDAASTTTAASTASTTESTSAATTAPPTTEHSPTTAPTTAPPTTIAPSTSAPATTTPPSSAPSNSVPDSEAYDWFDIVDALLRQRDELSVDPELEAVDELCVVQSPCAELWTANVEYFVDNDVHVEGSVPYELVAVDYQGTLDDVPLDEALIVNVIVRQTVTEQGDLRLVTADGETFAAVPDENADRVGRRADATFLLGRADLGAEWQLWDSNPGS